MNMFIERCVYSRIPRKMALTAHSYYVEQLPSPLSTVGEGPVWDIDRQCLFYVDIGEVAILRYDYAKNETYRATIDGTPTNFTTISVIILIQDNPDHFVLGTDNKLSLVQWDGLSKKATFVKFVADLGESESNVRFNDGKVDSHGRLYIGTMLRESLGLNLFGPKEGKFYRFDGRVGGGFYVQRNHVGISNGLTWNDKLGKMYFIDSMAWNVKQYDIAPSGDLCHEQVLFSFVDNGRIPRFFPDGMTSDEAGNLFVATWYGSRVFKINANDRRIEQEIWIPATQVTSVAFGGPKLDELFVTTSRSDFFDSQLQPGTVPSRPPASGALFKVKGLNVRGSPMHKMILEDEDNFLDFAQCN
ncbi:regucalcin-like [Ochlerotatus camptorhynchus]|uniref:regucalcin-like n=1 Tax=Ochlerotatus camptorhynchus TaxID=644619 RepID=UPI0031DF5510